MPNINPTDELIHDLLNDRRRERRWRNIRFFIGALLFLTMIALVFSRATPSPDIVGKGRGGYVALIRLNGLIAPGSDFSAETVLPLLEEAFTDKDAKGVVLDIDSGGGTPVQASIIHDAILELKQ